MAGIPFVPRIDDAPYATVEQMSPLVQRVICRNPSKFSYHGTGTYIIGSRQCVVIDPGPRIDSHRDALAAALKGRELVGIVVTHCHGDHSPLSAWMKDEYKVPTYAFGPHRMVEGWTEEDDHDPSEEDETEAKDEEENEPLDVDFRPDITVRDGDEILRTGEFSLGAVHTPGHTSNQLCVALPEEQTLFSGDHVMGWSTTIVSPPDGDMAAYFDSVRKVIGRDDALLRPTHGGPVTDPQPFLHALLQHRIDRENQVIDQLRSGVTTIPAMVKVLYANVDKRLHRPARRSIWSHVLKLHDEGRVRVTDGGAARLLAYYELVR